MEDGKSKEMSVDEKWFVGGILSIWRQIPEELRSCRICELKQCRFPPGATGEHRERDVVIAQFSVQFI